MRSTEESQPSMEGSRRFRGTAEVIAVAGAIAVTFALFAYVRGQETDEIRAEFKQAAAVHMEAIRNEVAAELMALESLGAFYSTLQDVDEETFAAFVNPIVSRVPGVQTLEWAPRVSRVDRALFEASARQAGLAGFRINERNDAGSFVPASNRTEYFPIRRLEPFGDSEPVLGLDLASEAISLEALTRSRDVGRTIATAPMTFMRNGREHLGFFVFLPVYAKGSRVDSVESRRRNLIGFVLGTFDAAAMVEHAVTGLEPGTMNIRISDLSATGSQRILYFHSPSSDSMARTAPEGPTPPPPPPLGLHEEITYKKGGRPWAIDFTPTPAFVLSRRTFQPWLTLLGGLTITALLAAYLGAARKRTKRIEGLVDERAAQLKASEGNLKTILDEALDGIISIDSRGVIELANPAAQNMFGFGAEELIGQNIKLLMPEPYHSDHSNYISDYLRTGDAKVIGKSLELSARRKDGSEIPIRLSVNEYQVNGMRKFVGMVQDLSEYKQMLETLRFRNDAIETSFDGIAITDLNGKMTYANKAVLRMWGYDSTEEILGRDPLAFWDHLEEARCVGRALQTTGSWSGELVAKRKDGSTFPVALSAHMATDKSGQPLCLMASCRDITERKKVEQELAKYQEHLQGLVDERTNELQEANELLHREIAERRRSEEAVRESEVQLRLMADSIPALIAYIDVERRYQFNNALYAEWFNMPAEECIGKYVWEVIGETIYEETREHIDEALSGRQVSFEQKLPLPSGATRHVQVNYVPRVDSEGMVQGFFALTTDLTAQKNMEERHRQAQRLEALGTLAGGIAHDFNNLLGAIIGFTSMAREDTGEDTELREDLDEVLSAANRARDLVAQILTFSRQTKENHAPVLLYPILEESIRLIEAVIPASIEITTAIDRECDAVMGDASRIHQVIMNLLTNAYHAMKERGGELHVTLDQVYVDAELAAAEPDMNEGPYARITVKDSGHGIAPEELERIYDPFFTTKDVGEGTGLGLSTVHGIVQVHGGAITARSEVGTGTTFTVYLPTTHEPERVDPPHEDSAPGGTERILIVEDEAMLLRVAERSLSKLGYRVTAFQSSLEALDEFRARPQSFDLIISDLNMPHMDGTAFAREALRARENVPIVLVTGYSDTLDAAAAARLGIRQMLSKPYTTQALAKTVRDAIGNPSD